MDKTMRHVYLLRSLAEPKQTYVGLTVDMRARHTMKTGFFYVYILRSESEPPPFLHRFHREPGISPHKSQLRRRAMGGSCRTPVREAADPPDATTNVGSRHGRDGGPAVRRGFCKTLMVLPFSGRPPRHAFRSASSTGGRERSRRWRELRAAAYWDRLRLPASETMNLRASPMSRCSRSSAAGQLPHPGRGMGGVPEDGATGHRLPARPDARPHRVRPVQEVLLLHGRDLVHAGPGGLRRGDSGRAAGVKGCCSRRMLPGGWRNGNGTRNR
jgi:hypothetical protein